MKSAKRIIFSLVVFSLLNAVFVTAVFADPTPAAGDTPAAPAAGAPAKEKSAIQETFDINQLRIGGKEEDKTKFPGQEQGQKYFKEAEELTARTGQEVSPVAAFIVDVIDFLVAVIGSVSLLIFIAGGLLTILSEGKEDRLQKGKEAMLFSIIGLVLALSAYLIAQFVQSIFF